MYQKEGDDVHNEDADRGNSGRRRGEGKEENVGERRKKQSKRGRDGVKEKEMGKLSCKVRLARWVGGWMLELDLCEYYDKDSVSVGTCSSTPVPRIH